MFPYCKYYVHCRPVLVYTSLSITRLILGDSKIQQYTVSAVAMTTQTVVKVI